MALPRERELQQRYCPSDTLRNDHIIQPVSYRLYQFHVQIQRTLILYRNKHNLREARE